MSTGRSGEKALFSGIETFVSSSTSGDGSKAKPDVGKGISANRKSAGVRYTTQCELPLCPSEARR